MSRRIGFVGLGAMGLPMALNLRKAGHAVIAMDINERCVRRFADAGGAATNSAEELVRSSDVVMTMLPAGDDVIACLRHFIDLGLRDKLFIDFSTVGVECARQYHELCKQNGLRCLEAPVTGGVIGAERGTLTLMVGGAEKDFDAAKPLLEAVGSAITFAGGPGCGQAVKVCNNMAAGIIKIAISEAFALARGLGVDDRVLFEAASKGSANCFALTSTCPVPGLVASAPSSRDYQGGFATKLMLKDMKLAQSAAAAYGVPATLGAVASSLYEHCVSAGLGDLDNAVIFKFITKDY